VSVLVSGSQIGVKLAMIVIAGASIGSALQWVTAHAHRSHSTPHASASPASSRAIDPQSLHVPLALGAISVDGDTDDPGWLNTPVARTGPLQTDKGIDASPYSQIRLVWGEGYLYLALYAADEDIRATHAEHDSPVWLDDSYHLTFTTKAGVYAIDLSPLGTTSDALKMADGKWDSSWESGAHVSRELDGTMNRPDDNDEEWELEVAIPFDALGLRGVPGESFGFAASRCDTPHRSARTCASWGENEKRSLVLDGPK
jgi:hypothetical protein